MQHSVRVILFCAVIAGVAVLAEINGIAGTVPAAGSGPATPTPSVSSTPTPTATPYPQSTITIRFVRDGEPVTIALTQPFKRIEADGVPCNMPVTHAIVFVDRFAVPWPPGFPGLAEPCHKEPPTTVRIEFHPYDPFDDQVLDPIAAEVLWAGDDVVADLEIPAGVPSLDDTPTPSPTATPYPQSTITIRFVRDGEPVQITSLTPIPRITVDGIDCNAAQLPLLIPKVINSYSFRWPPHPSDVDARCLDGPPTIITVQFVYPNGSFEVVIEWAGQGSVVDREVPAEAVVTPTPAVLPGAGGSPTAHKSGLPTVAAVATLILSLVVTASLLLRR